jgi:hypothetical protein
MKTERTSLAARLVMTARELVRDTWQVAIELFKVFIPAVVLVKILEEAGAVGVIARLLEPAMAVFGLPGEMAVVWTTAIVTNIYGAIAVLLLFAQDVQLTISQATVLATMILICHSLPVELALTHRVGGSYRFLGLLRFVGACIAGALLHFLYTMLGVLTQPATIIWAQQKVEVGLLDWVWNQCINVLYIVCVLFSLLTLMRFLQAIGFTGLMGRFLRPILLLMGISSRSASIAVFGLLAGITFGSGLLLAEVRKEGLPARDVVLVLAFLSLCHGIIEDTLLMLLIGADLSGILLFRFVFSILVIGGLARVPRIPLERFSSQSIA